MSIAFRHSTVALYSDRLEVASHRVRIALAEKGVTAEVVYTDRDSLPEELLETNPYRTLPTLVDRDLVLYEPDIITEYLDERFPHPPLLPVYPVERAKCRLLIHRIERDLLGLIEVIENGGRSEAEAARQNLYSQLVTIAPVFLEAPYFLSEDFSLVDCCLAPMFWRLSHLGIKLPAKTRAIHGYMQRVFARDSFRASLSDQERELIERR